MSAQRSRSAGGTMAARPSVRQMSGATALTRMPCGASSSASVRVRLTTPALAAAYAAYSGAARPASIDTTLTTLPPRPAAIRPRATSWVQCITDLAFARQSASQPFSRLSRNGAANVPPALFTRTSTGPNRALVASKARRTASGSRASAGSASPSPAFAAISAAVRSAVWGSRSSAATRAPKAASASATPFPMPAPAPVTSATRPSSETLSGFMRARSARRVGDEYPVAAAEAVAEVVGVRRPALGILLGVGLHQPLLELGILHERAGGLEAWSLRRAHRDARARPPRLDALDAPGAGPRADIDLATVVEEPDLGWGAELPGFALRLEVHVVGVGQRLLDLRGETGPGDAEGEKQGAAGQDGAAHARTLAMDPPRFKGLCLTPGSNECSLGGSFTNPRGYSSDAHTIHGRHRPARDRGRSGTGPDARQRQDHQVLSKEEQRPTCPGGHRHRREGLADKGRQAGRAPGRHRAAGTPGPVHHAVRRALHHLRSG